MGLLAQPLIISAHLWDYLLELFQLLVELLGCSCCHAFALKVLHTHLAHLREGESSTDDKEFKVSGHNVLVFCTTFDTFD